MLTMSTGKRIDRRTAEHSTERAKGGGERRIAHLGGQDKQVEALKNKDRDRRRSGSVSQTG